MEEETTYSLRARAVGALATAMNLMLIIWKKKGRYDYKLLGMNSLKEEAV